MNVGICKETNHMPSAILKVENYEFLRYYLLKELDYSRIIRKCDLFGNVTINLTKDEKRGME